MAVTRAVSSPKQRFNPRATLYSPPPSNTSKDRVVQVRRSPGSKRSITSPRLNSSQRHSLLGLICRDILSTSHFFNAQYCPPQNAPPHQERNERPSRIRARKR